MTLAHKDLPAHCAVCGKDWPKGYNGTCPSCRAGLPCRADTTDTVAPDPPCGGSRIRLQIHRHTEAMEAASGLSPTFGPPQSIAELDVPPPPGGLRGDPHGR